MAFQTDRRPLRPPFASVSLTLLAAYVVLNAFGVLGGAGGGTGRSVSAMLAHAIALASLGVIGVIRLTGASRRREPRHDPSPGLLTTVRRLSCAIDAADPFTRGRAYRVSRYSVRIAERLGIAPAETEDIEYAALLHDLGRVAIRRDVLLKSDRLTEAERREVESHPQVASDILSDILPLARAAELILAHHEQPDGKGYPRGLAGDRIPLGSTIIAAASAFDAMTSDRPYRSGLTPARALEELRSGAGTQFAPAVVDALIELHESRALFDGFDGDELRLYGDDASVLRALENTSDSPERDRVA